MKKLGIALGGVLALGALVVISLPAIMHRLGLHPAYSGQRYLLPEGKALIIATNRDRLGEGGAETGVFASELTAPYYEFRDARLAVDVASIEGGRIPFDPLSFRRTMRTPYDERFLEDPTAQDKVEQSLRVADVDFTKYDVIFLAGGWGAAYDLGRDGGLRSSSQTGTAG